MYCFVMLSLPCIYCPPFPPIDDTTAAVASPFDRLLRRRRPYPYRRASRQAEPLPLFLISPTCLYLSVALGICCCYVTFLFKCIAYHCRPLLYFSYPMQPDKY